VAKKFEGQGGHLDYEHDWQSLKGKVVISITSMIGNASNMDARVEANYVPPHTCVGGPLAPPHHHPL
jgi:hypothetical protein